MTPNDPRHGTWAGYVAGCRETCCREAARLYQKRRVHEGRPRRVPSVGTHRRIQALVYLGWDLYAIADAVGNGRDTVRQWLLHDTVYRSTHERMAAVYEELSMRLPPETTRTQRANAAKARNRARRNGWAPPLAWDDIDDPNEQPKGQDDKRDALNLLARVIRDARAGIDAAVVDRILAGDIVPSNRLEREEIVRRWRQSGRPMNELERLTGWKVARYSNRKDVA